MSLVFSAGEREEDGESKMKGGKIEEIGRED